MATSTLTGLTIDTPVPAVLLSCVRSSRRRSITPRAGHALEILGHAIEYLTDEFVNECGSSCTNRAQLDAVQLLMALNRQVYFECPEVPTIKERFRSLLKLQTH